ncbi:MAG: hypothetical protein MUC87_17840 [Bacteroidia bacterium]|jgi:hypothetical protein|nr:hypothetical protein [Bacteroidia bacterium]
MEQKIENISPRMSVVKGEQELSVVIAAALPSRKVTASGLLLLVWLLSGLAGIWYFFQLTESESVQRTYLLVWLGFWVYFLYIVGRAWSWWKFGNEIIKIRNGNLLLKRDVRGRGYVHEYKLSTLKNIRAGTDNTPNWVNQIGGNWWSTDASSVSFESGDKEVALGYQLSAKERDQLISLLRQYQKKLAETGNGKN